MVNTNKAITTLIRKRIIKWQLTTTMGFLIVISNEKQQSRLLDAIVNDKDDKNDNDEQL